MHSVSKTFTFDAAHSLPGHGGACRNLHGHTYRVTVFCRGNLADTGSSAGMVVDFGDLKSAWRGRVHSELDHQHLNDVSGLENPTAELMAEWIYHRMYEAVPTVYAVEVWETPTSCSRYEP